MRLSRILGLARAVPPLRLQTANVAVPIWRTSLAASFSSDPPSVPPPPPKSDNGNAASSVSPDPLPSTPDLQQQQQQAKKVGIWGANSLDEESLLMQMRQEQLMQSLSANPSISFIDSAGEIIQEFPQPPSPQQPQAPQPQAQAQQPPSAPPQEQQQRKEKQYWQAHWPQYQFKPGKSDELKIVLPRVSDHDDLLDNSYSLQQFDVFKLVKSRNVIVQEQMSRKDLLQLSGLHPRDLRFLDPSTTDRYQMPFIHVVTGKSILFSIEQIKAIIQADRVILVDIQRPAVRTFASYLLKCMQLPLTSSFELRMLESMLAHTVLMYERHLGLLSRLMESQLSSLTTMSRASPRPEDLRRFLPLSHSLTEMQNGIAEATGAVEDVVKSNKLMQRMNLSGWQPGMPADGQLDRHHREIEEMLRSFIRQFYEISNEFTQVRKELESTQEVINITLDSDRNRMLSVQVYLSILTISLASFTAVTSLFGMNLLTGLEAMPRAFHTVTATAATAGVLSFVGGYLVADSRLFRRHPWVDQDVATIGKILADIDDIEVIFSEFIRNHGNSITKAQFKELLDKSVRRRLTDAEFDVVFRAFDSSARDPKRGLADYERYLIAQRRKYRYSAGVPVKDEIDSRIELVAGAYNDIKAQRLARDRVDRRVDGRVDNRHDDRHDDQRHDVDHQEDRRMADWRRKRQGPWNKHGNNR